MTQEQFLARIAVDPAICRGRPHVRGTRIFIAIILDALTEGLTVEEVLACYPCLEREDVEAAVDYASWLAEKNGGLAFINIARQNQSYYSLL
jgi:uncharacterized protein (DUF433 family)